MKTSSVFYPPEAVARARANIEKHDWAREARDTIVERAQPMLEMSDDALWDAMFGHTITRSWMVWSDGHCPACKADVPMYSWNMDAFAHPWKTQCPHCSEFFPKNDFEAYYRSGLDAAGVFDPGCADRSLLFNAEHPDPDDPLRNFGVDDGEGYVEGDKRWRFIGAYLVYGQWKQLVQGGACRLAAAYTVSGDARYAHKAAILLDRIADLHPDFDWGKQGLAYETGHGAGYVSTWHDACEETRELVLAYDQVADAMEGNDTLVEFLSSKAKQHALDNAKTSVADIQRNIEDRIFRDAIAQQHKIHSNFPRQEIAIAVMGAVMDWPSNRDVVMEMINDLVTKSTAVDGVTGEKGLAGYSAFVIQAMATFLGDCERMQPGFLDAIYARHPVLHQSYRFHIDTWCLQRYYPLVGDTLWFGMQAPNYQGLRFKHAWSDEAGYQPWKLEASPYTFLWWLYRASGDPAFAQIMVHQNAGSVEGVPYDLFAEDPRQMQVELGAVSQELGSTVEVASVNKKAWHIGILRSGEGEQARAAWMAYGVERNHKHQDGMNLGLFAHGLDLMPDFGYPPVQFGGWNNPKADWYRGSASHNTVVVDGKNHESGRGKTTFWADQSPFQVMRCSCPRMIDGRLFERTVILVDVSDESFYLFDVFRVAGGHDHAKFFHSHFGTVTPAGLNLQPGEDYGNDTFMRDFRVDPNPELGWSVDWVIEDRRGYLEPRTPVHLRYTDLTRDAEAHLCEGWICADNYESTEEAWIPRVMTRRRSQEGELESTFVAVIEPYRERPSIEHIERLPEPYVTVDLTLTDGRRDLIVLDDPEGGEALSALRRPADGEVLASLELP